MAIKPVVSLNLRIDHRLWEEALSLAYAYITMALPGEVVCITGPSRAGKTRLIVELVILLSGCADEDGRLQPCVVVEAGNTGPNGSFSTKAFTQAMLAAIKHPMLSVVDDTDSTADKRFERTTEARLRSALERGLKSRGVKYLFIDEAQHARYVSKDAMGSCGVMDSWKNLAQAAGVILVVVGAYPILEILRNSPHLLGRKHQVHLPRYQKTLEDIKEFALIVTEYEKKLQVCVSLGGLINQIEFLYDNSFGCIGLLRAWLMRASAMASVKNSPITLPILQQSRASDDDLSRIGREIYDGEALLEGGLSGAPVKTKPTAKKERKPSKTKPFQKKPRRLAPGHRSEGNP